MIAIALHLKKMTYRGLSDQHLNKLKYKYQKGKRNNHHIVLHYLCQKEILKMKIYKYLIGKRNFRV